MCDDGHLVSVGRTVRVRFLEYKELAETGAAFGEDLKLETLVLAPKLGGTEGQMARSALPNGTVLLGCRR